MASAPKVSHIRQMLLQGQALTPPDVVSVLRCSPTLLSTVVREMKGQGYVFEGRREGRTIRYRVTGFPVNHQTNEPSEAPQGSQEAPTKSNRHSEPNKVRDMLFEGRTVSKPMLAEMGLTCDLGGIIANLESKGYVFKKARMPGKFQTYTLKRTGPARATKEVVRANGHTNGKGHWLPVPEQTPPLGSLWQISAVVLDRDGSPAIVLRSQEGVSFGATLNGVHVPG